MPKGPIKFPHRFYLRLSGEGKANLEKQAKLMDLKPNIAGRVIIESQVSGSPITVAPDPRYKKLLSKFVKKFGGTDHPGHQNWNEIKRLVDDAKALIEEE